MADLIQIDKRTAIVAFAALLLSIVSAATSASSFFYGYTQGVKIDVERQERVTFTKDDLGQDKEILHMSATLVFTNRSQIGYDAIIKEIAITLQLPDGSRYDQEWHRFVTFFNNEGILEKGEPEISAVPIHLKAKNMFSRNILFAPFRKRCTPTEKGCNELENYLEWDEFIGKLKAGEGGQIEIAFTIDEALEERPIPLLPCTIEIDKDFIRTVEYYGWNSTNCWSSEK